MKRSLATAIFLFLLLSTLAHAAFGIFQTYAPGVVSNPNLREENLFGLKGSAWQTPANYYVPGTGSPAVSTADYWHYDGAQWARPYDLTAADCGATGASIAASRGRYVWLVSHDHADGNPWTDAAGMALGYSNDPGVPPARMNLFYPYYRLTAFAQVATVTASISDGSGNPGNRLIVTSAAGTITVDGGSSVTGSGVTQAAITSQLSGTLGGNGTYVIGGAAQLVASQAMTIGVPNLKVGQGPYLVCNPDDATYPFYVYSQATAGSTGLEGSVTRSSDLISWTDAELSHVNYFFSGMSGYQKVARTGVNTWYSLGFQTNFPQTPGGVGFAKWTSSDGRLFSPNPSTLLNGCLPTNASGVFGNIPCTQPIAKQFEQSGSPTKTTVASQDYAVVRTNSVVNSVRTGSQWLSRVPIDANFNAVSSPSRVDISAPYAGLYPGPSYLQASNAYGPEDGIMHYYVQMGFPPSNGVLNGTADARRYINGGACVQTSDGTYGSVGYIAGTTLHITSTPTPVPVGAQIMGGPTPAFITAQLPTDPGDVGTYTITVSQTYASGNITIATCGGLNEQGLDYYTEIVDATAAAAAAPVGVRASCASSTSTINWYVGVTPTDTMRLYRGTTAGSQPTLVGNFTGGVATDTGMTLNSVTYYKLVYVNSGVEQKNRVVSTYCSSSIYPEVNAHITRALAEGADPTTCDRTFMDTFYGWLTSNGLKNSLLFATMPEFCVAKSGSVITKVFDMGTTRLPRGGDYTPTTSSTTYNATGINSKPAWVNGAANAYGYYGSGRYNNIRRRTQITLLSAYQKPGTAALTPFALGQFGNRMMLTHTSGTPGAINCLMSDATTQQTATATPASATAVNTSACTFDGTTLLAYSNATPGSGQTGLVIPSPTLNPPDILTGQIDNNASASSNTRALVSGSDQGIFNNTTGYSMNGNQSLGSVRAQMIFDKALSGAQVTSWDAMVR